MDPALSLALLMFAIAIAISFFVAGLIKFMLFVIHRTKKRVKTNKE